MTSFQVQFFLTSWLFLILTFSFLFDNTDNQAFSRLPSPYGL